jgi:pimeloyl-ACP methyl ester carboxylesterase
VPYADVDGIRIYYEEHGEGRPLLMIMGLSANLDWWEPALLARLAENNHVVIFDNRGAGRTDKPKGDYTIPMMASDVAGLMRSAGIGQACVLGASMGGMIAQQFALDYPEMTERLILCCTNCGGREQVLAKPEVYEALMSPPGATTIEDFARASLPINFPDSFLRENQEKIEEFIRRFLIAPMPAHAFIAQYTALSRWRDFSRLPEIKSPTLVLTGDSDILIPPENSRILAENIPGAKLIAYTGGGHLFMAQFPELVAADILAFLEA